MKKIELSIFGFPSSWSDDFLVTRHEPTTLFGGGNGKGGSWLVGFWYFLYGKFTRKFRYASLAKFIMWNLFSIKTILAIYTFFQNEIFVLGSLRRKRNDS